MSIPQLAKIGPKRRQSLNDFRIEMGLEPIKAGKVECLRCGVIFKSDDMKRVRRCPTCRRILSDHKWNTPAY